MRISDWSSDVCSSDLRRGRPRAGRRDDPRALRACARRGTRERPGSGTGGRMTARVSDVFARRPARSGPPEQSSVLAALAVPLFVVDGDGHFYFANQAAEQFLDFSTANLLGRPRSDMLPEDSPIFGVIRQDRKSTRMKPTH